jgi:c-di-GMP-binding flagellar brake protein YcgR
MEAKLIVNSIGIGGAIFVGLILFWFVFVYLKKRMTSDQSASEIYASNKIALEEKRRHPRIAIAWQAVIEQSGHRAEVQLRDISLGGAFVVCADPLALNQKFKISINIPDQEPLLLNAEVVWSNANIPRDKVVNRGMGIRFIENEEQERRRLQEAIAAALEKEETAKR